MTIGQIRHIFAKLKRILYVAKRYFKCYNVAMSNKKSQKEVKSENTRRIINLCIKLLITGVGILLAGLLLLIGVYMLPTGRMKAHIADSHELFNYEGNYPEIMYGMKGTRLDNYTDGLMYATAIHPGSGNAIQDAMNNARYEYKDTGMVQSLNDYANDVLKKEPLRYEIKYSRYWHGYLVVLKPVLLFLDVSEIRMLNMFMQIVLLFLLLYLILKKFGTSYTIPIIMMVLVLNPVVLPLSLQFSWVYYISLIGAIILLALKYPPESDNYLVLFMAIGMMTSYFDLLTYPLITLGLPLVLFLIKAGNLKPLRRILITGVASCFWLGGYALMWGGKWVFVFLLGHKEKIFVEVSKQISLRTSMVDDAKVPFTLGLAMEKLGDIILDKTYLFMFGCALIGYIVWFVCESRRSRRKRVDQSIVVSGTKQEKTRMKLILLYILPYVFIALLPFAWFVIFSNHTREHIYFTYRELAVTVLAIGTAISECIQRIIINYNSIE